MKLEIKKRIIEEIKTACNGYDVPITKKEFTELINDMLEEWALAQ